MYPETVANDNPDLAVTKLHVIVTSPPRTKVARATAIDCWRAFLGRFFSAVYFVTVILFACEAEATEKLRLAVQKTGTLAWELAVITGRGLDKEAGLDLEVAEIATPEAAKIALLGGAADIILSDWLWVARQRNLGRHLVFWPYSTALGAVMIPASSPIRDLSDLKGKKLAVAGGPLDKSWLLLQALAAKSNLDLAHQATILYGAPPLLYQKAAAGEADATLNYWTFCVALESLGFRRLIDMEEVERRLGVKGPVAMVGYVFDERFAQAHAAVLSRFFEIAAKAKDVLSHSDEDWQTIAKRVGIAQRELALYRAVYVKGFPKRSIAEEAADARVLYKLLAEIGGPDLVGNADELDEATFYRQGKRPPAQN